MRSATTANNAKQTELYRLARVKRCIVGIQKNHAVAASWREELAFYAKYSRDETVREVCLLLLIHGRLTDPDALPRHVVEWLSAVMRDPAYRRSEPARQQKATPNTGLRTNRRKPTSDQAATGAVAKPSSLTGYFSGHYPKQPTHTCRNAAILTSQDDDSSVYLSQATDEVWRPRIIDGVLVPVCPGCLHKKVLRMCLQIEQEVMKYPADASPFRTANIVTAEADKLVKALKKWGDRFDLGDFRYVMRPMIDGSSLLVHNYDRAPSQDKRVQRTFQKIAGNDLPKERVELYALIEDSLLRADDKRIRCTNGWGEKYQGSRCDGRRQSVTHPSSKSQLFARDYQKSKFVLSQYIRQPVAPGKIEGLTMASAMKALRRGRVPYFIRARKQTQSQKRRSQKDNRDLARSYLRSKDRTKSRLSRVAEQGRSSQALFGGGDARQPH